MSGANAIRERLRRRVKQGAALLDEERPGWFKSVDLDHLDMSDGSRCILGYAFKRSVNAKRGWWDGFEAGVKLLGVGDVDEDQHPGWRFGFCLAGRDDELDEDEAWGLLGDLWALTITARRNGDSAEGGAE